MKITFLGTNGWYDTRTGNTVCTLIETSEYYLVFEAGDGIYKLDKYIKTKKPIYLFISHFHIDHVSGLHILPKFKFKNPIKIFIAKGRKKDFTRLVGKPYMSPINSRLIKQKVAILELKYGINNIPFKITAKKLNHIWSSIGFRAEIDGKIVTHCMDTGMCRNAEVLAKNADILIFDCSLLSHQLVSEWGHSSPEEILRLAEKSKIKKLILSHFGANNYDSLAKRKLIQNKTKKYSFKTIIATDDDSLIV